MAGATLILDDLTTQVLWRECSAHGDHKRRPGHGEVFARRWRKLPGLKWICNFLFSLILLKKANNRSENPVQMTVFRCIFSKWVKSSPHLSVFQEPCFGNFFSTTDQQPSRFWKKFRNDLSTNSLATLKSQWAWNHFPTTGPMSWPRRGLSSGKQQTMW